MCGRYYFDADPAELAAHFDLVTPPALTPPYNVAPTQKVAVVVQQAGSSNRKLGQIRWGLVPSWANSPAGPPLVNARGETVDRLPTFRESFESRRCLIPASGFFEWKATGKAKTPYLFRPHEHWVLAFAGIYDRWVGDGPAVWSCAVITTEANGVVRPFHDRMPVVLSPDHFTTWLDDDTPVP